MSRRPPPPPPPPGEEPSLPPSDDEYSLPPPDEDDFDGPPSSDDEDDLSLPASDDESEAPPSEDPPSDGSHGPPPSDDDFDPPPSDMESLSDPDEDSPSPSDNERVPAPDDDMSTGPSDSDPEFDPDEDPSDGPEDSEPEFDPDEDLSDGPEDSEPDFEPDEEPVDFPDDDESDDVPPPPPGGPPVAGKFNVPVAVPTISALSSGHGQNPPAVNKPPKSNALVPELSMGLAIKGAPQILRKPSAKGEPTDSGDGLGSPPKPDSENSRGGAASPLDSDVPSSPVFSSPGSDSIVADEQLSEEEMRVKEKVAQLVHEKGYISAQGKFDGDPFEHLYIRVDKEADMLYVLVETGQEVEFDLLRNSFVFEDTQDPTTFILDHKKTIIVFKVETVDVLNSIMKRMPPAVFMVADLNEKEQKLAAEQKTESRSSSVSKKAPAGSKLSIKPAAVNRTKGTSVEDLLENEFEGGNKNEEHAVEELFHARSAASVYPQYKDPQRRKELIDSYIRKPKYSVRRVALVCAWVNSLHIWASPLTINTLHKEICNGLLLSRIVKVVNPSVQFLNINEQPRAKRPALENLEQALGHLWRSKALNTTRIPSALEIYNGNSSKIAILLNEMYSVYVLKPLLKSTIKILKWYHQILKQYFLPLPKAIFEEGDLSGLWPHFQSGTALFCLLYHLFGPNMISAATIAQGLGTANAFGGHNNRGAHEAAGAAHALRVDPLRVCGSPISLSDYRDNCSYVFALLNALGIDVLWTPEDWITNPDTEFVLLQLGYIYESLKHKQCSLPPAHGGNPGLSAGPNGEPIVSGVIFKDSRPLHSRVVLLERKTVLLGQDSGSIPLIPVDRAGKKGRFINSTICPRGMLANSVAEIEVPQIQIALKEVKVYAAKSEWNKSAMIDSEKYSHTNGHVLGLLHNQNKRNPDGTLANATLGPSLKPNSPSKSKRVDSSSLDESKLVDVFSGKFAGAGMLQPGRDLAGVDVTIQGSAEDRQKEVDQAIKNLEKEMAISDEQLTSLEEDLANKYIELEATAEAVDIADYEAVLDTLEKERVELEEEKERMQDHFARKLKAIKSMYVDIEDRNTWAQPMGIASGESKTTFDASGRTPSKLNASALNATSAGRRTRLSKEEKEQEKRKLELAEKSWIKVAKNTTHNFHLKNKQAESSNALKAAWTPKALKEKEKQREAALKEEMIRKGLASTANKNPRDSLFSEAGDVSSLSRRGGRGIVGGAGVGSFGAAGGVNDSMYEASELLMSAAMSAHTKDIPETVRNNPILMSFHKFKVRLHISSVQFMEKQNRAERVRLKDLMQETVVRPAELIALPKRSQEELDSIQQQQEQQEFENYWSTLRAEELGCMSYEDARRREVLNDLQVQEQITILAKSKSKKQSCGGSVASSTRGQASASETDHNAAAEDAGSVLSQSQSAASRKPSAAEMDASFKWLNTPRVLTLAERAPKEFVFTLVVVASTEMLPASSGRSSSPMQRKPPSKLSYLLEWRERSESTHQPPTGSVNLDDIMDIISSPNKAKADPCLLTLKLNESPRALKGSRGRTHLPLRCSTPGECIKCVTSLNNLRYMSRPAESQYLDDM